MCCCWRGWRVALVGLWRKCRCDAWARALGVYGFRFECKGLEDIKSFEIGIRAL